MKQVERRIDKIIIRVNEYKIFPAVDKALTERQKRKNTQSRDKWPAGREAVNISGKP